MEQYHTLFPPVFSIIARWIMILSLGILLISMASGKAGLSNYLELVSKEDALKNEIIALESKIQILNEQKELLRDSKFHRIRYLKEDLGFVEDGEIVLHLKDFNAYQNLGPVAMK